MNILAIGAHPDDIEILCAGTLAHYAKQGHNVFMASFTCGDMGDLIVKPVALARIRRVEAQAAADVIGAKLLWPGIKDAHVFPDAEQRRVMIDLLREADPDIVFTHSPNDYHPDHRHVSQLVFDSYFPKGLPHIPRQKRRACRFGQTQVYYMDNIAGIGFEPQEYVDISETMETKLRMIRCHKSQLVAVKDLAATDMVEMARIQSAFRGLAAGCRHAEGFRRLEAFQRGLTRRVLP